MGYVRRINVYFAEMLPLPQHILIAALTYLSITVFLHSTEADSSAILSWRTAGGIWGVFNLFLLLRLMDELKDRDIDPKIFPERPLPSGRVLERDVRQTLTAALIAYLLVHYWLGSAWYTGLVVIGYLSLMYFFFFAPEAHRRSLLLSLMTHGPIIPLMLLNAMAVAVGDRGATLLELEAATFGYILVLWPLFLGWELSRKVRRPADETEYMTYSKVFGFRRAALIVWLVQSTSFVACVYFFLRAQLDALFYLVPVLAYLLVTFAAARFAYTEQTGTAPLRPFSEAYVVLMLSGQIVSFWPLVNWI